MLDFIAKKIFGSVNDRVINRMKPTIARINELEKRYMVMTDENLREQTNIFKSRLKAGESLEDILPAAFAVVREAAKRVLGQRHYDVQLIGGIILHQGKIAEMRTGEGKTLVATLPSYLNALTEKGVHVVTVNDYLAKRDSEWMGGVHRFLGLKVGCIYNQMDDEARKEAYACDITYGTNSEFGFDYLRDNMKYSTEDMVQREFNYAIVDEVDSILIDEARTPLIISGPTDDNSDLYYSVDKVVSKLDNSFCNIDEKERAVSLTEEGTEKVEKEFKEAGIISEDSNLYDITNSEVVHHLNQALKAHKLFKNEVDYIVKDGQVYIVDEFTGRTMEGRRFSDGLHQALEAKEHVQVQNENQTLASITYQNYFRMYPKLAGMTGTAMTEALEFEHIYKLKVVEVPTNKEVQRIDEDDVIYKTEKEKYKAIIEQIEKCRERRQPVLVGTVSIEKSEYLSDLLRKKKIPHQVLNAKHHEKEAKIIAQAGTPDTITIATNMAGRGTDIMLGGNAESMIKDMHQEIVDSDERKQKEKEILEKVAKDKEIVMQAGGLFILGTERHESRRIDNQLRGRSGRQGDPGHSKFFLSLEDDLMRIFGTNKLAGMLEKMGLKEDEAITHPWISKALEKAQKKVENFHYEARKTVLKYDDIVNEQRKIIFDLRKEIINSTDLREELNYMIEDKNNELLQRYIPKRSYVEQWDIENLGKEIGRIYDLDLDLPNLIKEIHEHEEELAKRLDEATKNIFVEKVNLYGEGIMLQILRRIYLSVLDRYWKEHLYSLDQLRKGIGLRAYGQKDPFLEYKREAFDLFENLMYNMNSEVVFAISHVKINLEGITDELGSSNLGVFNKRKMQENRSELVNSLNAMKEMQQQQIPNLAQKQEKVVSRKSTDIDPNDPSTWGRVKRNDPCPCGSGKKYKQCHGAF